MECLKTDYFITIFSMCVLVYLPGCFVNLNYKSFILNRINDDFLASVIATISCICLIVGRIVSGILFDKMKIMDLLRVFLLLLIIGHVILYMIGYNIFWIIVGMMITFFADGA